MDKHIRPVQSSPQSTPGQTVKQELHGREKNIDIICQDSYTEKEASK